MSAGAFNSPRVTNFNAYFATNDLRFNCGVCRHKSMALPSCNRRLDLAREPDMNKADEKGEDDMASVVERIALPISPDHVWKLIGGFGSLPTGFPLFRALNFHDGGRIRRFFNGGGARNFRKG